MNLWGGRFDKEPNAAIAAFTHSLPFDQRMAVQDVRGSIAHCRMLGHTGILSAEEAAQIGAGLREILERVCLAGLSLEAAERELKLPRRSGKTVLKLALQRLAAHYGMR